MSEENKNKALNILLVEDSETDAYTVQRALGKYMNHPCTLQHVESMKAAEQYLQKTKQVDVILLDLGLPDTSGGKDTYERINNAKSENVPVIILTSVHDHDLAVGMVESGAEDFVKKSSVSADPEVLCDAIEFSVRRHNNLEELKEETDALLHEKDNVINWMAGNGTTSSDKD